MAIKIAIVQRLRPETEGWHNQQKNEQEQLRSKLCEQVRTARTHKAMAQSI